MRPDDIILICTDGLSDYLKANEIVHFLLKHPGELDDAVNEMILLACDRGGHDNITVVALQLPDGKPLSKVDRLFGFFKRE